MTTARVTVMTLKGGGVGAPLSLDASRSDVACLKQKIASRLNGSSAADMKLVFRAKPLFNESMLLKDVGIQGDCIVHVVYRVHGGAPGGILEVARQVRAVQKAGLHGVQLVEFDAEDPMVVNIALLGASDTPFQGRQLFMTLKFPTTYPVDPPAITFQHPLYHPNIYERTNRLCWSDDDNTGSTYNLEGIIGMVNTLMAKPNPASPANRQAAQLYMRDPSAWRDTAHAMAEDLVFRL